MPRFIVCRPLSGGLISGCVAGPSFMCEACTEPLQLSLGGLGMLQAHPDSRMLCNFCGLLHAQLSEAFGSLTGIELSPMAKAQIESGNDSPLTRWLRGHKGHRA